MLHVTPNYLHDVSVSNIDKIGKLMNCKSVC